MVWIPDQYSNVIWKPDLNSNDLTNHLINHKTFTIQMPGIEIFLDFGVLYSDPHCISLKLLLILKIFSIITYIRALIIFFEAKNFAKHINLVMMVK